MPIPLIELQRRLSIVGAIRAGAEKAPKAPGKRLENWRITSPRRELLEQAAHLYGGSVSPWQSPVGDEWQLYTDAPELPVLVMPSYSLRQTYELWEGPTKRLRLCDGIEEELTGGPCLCQAEGNDRCDIYTRVVVALPELDTVLGWKLTTTGASAAHELPTMFQLIEHMAQGQTFVPARLRLDQRRGMKEGQVVRFVVPVLDLGVGYLALAGGERNGSPALPAAGDEPATFTPVESRGPTLKDALSGAVSPSISPPRGRASAPLDAQYEPDEQPAELPVVEANELGAYEQARQNMLATEAQTKKLNLLVGKLRDSGAITTRHVYGAVGGMRGMNAERLIVSTTGATDDEGELHWSPLRETLTRPEAHELIDRLEKMEVKT